MIDVREPMNGITHNIHVRTERGEIEEFEGVLDVMKLPNDSLKFTHNGELTQLQDGEVIRSRVTNVDDAHKYVCERCESDESALVTSADFGEDLVVKCPVCGTEEPFERGEL